MIRRDHVDQSIVDLNLRDNSPFAADVFSLAGRIQVPPSALLGRIINLVYFGQSGSDNSILGMSSPTHGNAIFNTSIAHRGAIFRAIEPLLTGSLLLGHRGMYLADLLIGAGLCDTVNIIVAAIGGVPMSAWSPNGGTEGPVWGTVTHGALAYRIGLAARTLAAAQMLDHKTVIILSEGEASCSDGTSQANYAASQRGFIGECGNTGLLRRGKSILFIDQTTLIAASGNLRDPIRAAQAGGADGDMVWLGVDCDNYGASSPLQIYRQADGVHFLPFGAVQLATAIVPKIAAWLSGN